MKKTYITPCTVAEELMIENIIAESVKVDMTESVVSEDDLASKTRQDERNAWDEGLW